MTDTSGRFVLQELSDTEAAAEEEAKANREYKRIPNDTELVAEVVKAQIRTMPFNERDADGNILDRKAERVEFEFKILDSEWKNFRVWGETYVEFKRSSRCRLYVWVQELFGQEIGPNFTLDLDHLVGLRGRIMVGLREWEKDNKKGSKNYVKWVSRLRGDEDAAAGTSAETRFTQSTTAASAAAFDDFDEPF